MTAVLVLSLLAAGLGSQPLALNVEQERDALMVDFEILEPLPAAFETALPSGAVVRLVYPIQLRSSRRLMWDRRVWRGQLAVSAVFDPITGRYRCESVLDDVIVASHEFPSIGGALEWLADPPEVRLAMHDHTRWRNLRVRVKVIFSSSTTWLIFPKTDGTDWVEVRLDNGDEKPSDESDAAQEEGS